MDENFRGNPNPLNQNAGAVPNMGSMRAGQMGANRPVRPAQQAPNPMNRPMQQMPNPMNRPMQQAPTSPMGMSNNGMPSSTPMRPTQQAPVPEPPVKGKKKKNAGIIIAVIIGALALIGAGVAAAIMLLSNNDPVSKAMEKIVANEMPEYTAINGTIELTPANSGANSARNTVDTTTKEAEASQSDETVSPISIDNSNLIDKIKIELNSQLSSRSLVNSSSANVTLTIRELGEISFAVSEIYPSNGDLYLKIDDFKTPFDAYTNTLNTINKVTESTINNSEVSNIADNIVADQQSMMLSAVSEELNNMMKGISGQWLMIPLFDVNELAASISQSEDVSCETSLVNDLKNNANQIAQLYRGNNFISSTTENVSIASKNTPVRKFVFDDEKLNNFADQFSASGAILNYKKCANIESDDARVLTLQNMPTIYAEVDDSYNFTRLYTEIFLEDADMNMVIDMNLSYPANINVAEPDEYINLMENIEGLLPNSADKGENEANGEAANEGEILEVIEDTPLEIRE